MTRLYQTKGWLINELKGTFYFSSWADCTAVLYQQGFYTAVRKMGKPHDVFTRRQRPWQSRLPSLPHKQRQAFCGNFGDSKWLCESSHGLCLCVCVCVCCYWDAAGWPRPQPSGSWVKEAPWACVWTSFQMPLLLKGQLQKISKILHHNNSLLAARGCWGLPAGCKNRGNMITFVGHHLIFGERRRFKKRRAASTYCCVTER